MPRKSPLKVGAQFDIGAVVGVVAKELATARESGAASIRADVDTLSRALVAANARNDEREAYIAKLHSMLESAAGANVQLRILDAKKEIALEDIKSLSNIVERVLGVVKEPLDLVTRRLLPSFGDRADSGEQSFKSAVLRLFGRIAGPETPEEEQAQQILSKLAGPQDWALIIGGLSTFASGFASPVADSKQQ